MSIVMPMDECPSRLLTTSTGIPAASIRDAWPWRRSCRRTCGSPASAARDENSLETSRLYESPFTDHAPQGPDLVLPGQDLDIIITTLNQVRAHAIAAPASRATA